jgi:hypothetical protein
MPDWKDFAVVLCVLLVVVGAGALAVASQTFTIVKGRVLEKGVANLGGNPVQTISIVIENDDRVFKIKRGTLVKYAISDADAGLVQVGSEIELWVSSYSSKARVLSP